MAQKIFHYIVADEAKMLWTVKHTTIEQLEEYKSRGLLISDYTHAFPELNANDFELMRSKGYRHDFTGSFLTA